MEAFFFGSSSSPLYGVYHPAHSAADRFEGIVLCYPFGQEYMRAHRAFRQLSNMLAQKGYHVLRFDYRGTGDSAGELEDFTPNDWLTDTEMAVQELRDVAGVKKVSLLGLRLGGLLAAKTAHRLGDLSRLILWDPVLSGCDYIDELTNNIHQAKKTTPDESKALSSDGSIHFNGFGMSRDFQEKLKELDLRNIPTGLAGSSLLVVSHETEGFKEIKEHWADNTQFSYQFEPAPHDWNYVDHVGGIMLPQPILQAITRWVS